MKPQRNIIYYNIIIILLFTTAVWSNRASAQTHEQRLPGERQAVEQAIEKSVVSAVHEMTESWPVGVRSIIILPLFNDDDEQLVTNAVQHEFVREGSVWQFTVLSPDDKRWSAFASKLKSSGVHDNTLSEDDIRTLGHELGVDALVWGQVIHREMDDSKLKGHGSVQLFLSVADTGQIATSGRGDAKVLLSAETGALWLIQQGWFIRIAVIASGIIAAGLLFLVLFREQIALILKRRKIIH